MSVLRVTVSERAPSVLAIVALLLVGSSGCDACLPEPASRPSPRAPERTVSEDPAPGELRIERTQTPVAVPPGRERGSGMDAAATDSE